MRFARLLLIVLLLVSTTPAATARSRETPERGGLVSRTVARIVRLARSVIAPSGRMSPPVGSPAAPETEPPPPPVTTT